MICLQEMQASVEHVASIDCLLIVAASGHIV